MKRLAMSGSVVCKFPTVEFAAAFSGMILGEREMSVGVSLTGVMLIRDVAGGFDDSDGESLSEITVVKVRAEVLFRAVV